MTTKVPATIPDMANLISILSVIYHGLGVPGSAIKLSIYMTSNIGVTYFESIMCVIISLQLLLLLTW